MSDGFQELIDLSNEIKQELSDYANAHWIFNQEEWEKKIESIKCKAYQQGREDREKELVGVIKQVIWERDVAIYQLEQLGYGFGEKIEKSSSDIEKDSTVTEERK